MQTKYADIAFTVINLQTCGHMVMQYVYLQGQIWYFGIHIYFWQFLTKFLDYRKNYRL